MLKIRRLDEIAGHLAGGRHLVFHASVSEPEFVGRQLIDGAHLWPDLTVETFMPGAPCAYLGDDRIRVSTVVPGAHLRAAINDGAVQPIRESLYEQAMAYQSGKRRANVVVLQVSPVDRSGNVSLGPSIGMVPQLLDQNPFVIGVVNPQVPRTHFTIPFDRLQALMEIDQPLPEFTPSNRDEIDHKIAENVLPILDDGITIEVGMGSTPDVVMRSLSQLKDIRIHTGLINDTIMEVVESGATKLPVTTTMAVGTQKFYQWLDNNDRVKFRPIIETHDRDRLAQLPRFYAINAALQVDLAGNVNSEKIGERLISCPGGLPDFAEGARRSEGGCNIIVLRSAAGSGAKSTIVPKLQHVTLDGSCVDFIVTENGSADLRRLNEAGRAEAIRSIAHPSFERSRN